MRVNDLVNFIAARESVRLAKERGDPKPWTKNPILQDYRFCNIRREDDTVTKWLAANWRGPHAPDPDLWFGMLVGRLFNWPPTLGAVGYPVPYRGAAILKKINVLKKSGFKVFSSAYIVSTNGHAQDKAEYLVEHVLNPAWAARKHLRPYHSEPLFHFYERLLTVNGLGSFMAAQIIADVKYVEPLCSASDWWGFAAPGPGSQRGLARVYEIPTDSHWRRGTWHSALMALAEKLNPELRRIDIGALHNQDIQNCLCEFDKYERVRLGEGRPRNNYPGGA
jgi:hypothetical protein